MLALLLGIGLLVAYAYAGDYGESWDESYNRNYGYASRLAYGGSRDFMSYGDQVYHGPFYVMIWTRISPVLGTLNPNWRSIEGGHFLNFLTFLAGSAALYSISSRMVSEWIALAMTSLYVTQPLIFGHAFINQKDTPFAALMMVSIAFGIFVVDRRPRVNRVLPGARAPSRSGDRGVRFEKDLGRLRPWVANHIMLTVSTLAALGIVATFVAGFPYTSSLESTVRDAYFGRSLPVINHWFASIAQYSDRIPAEAYVAKALALYNRARLLLGVLLVLGLIGIAKAAFPRALEEFDRPWLLQACFVIFAGALVGLATSIRVAGPLAGALVSFYFVARLGRRAVPSLIAYWSAAGVACYASWPFLWGTPITRAIEAYRAMADYSGHDHILFEGAYVSSTALPWNYFGTLLVSELTLPALVLFVYGALVLVKRIRRANLDWRLAAIPIAWFTIPFMAFLIMRTPIYDNLRQVLFAMPPVFIIGGFAMEDIACRLSKPTVTTLLMICLLVPGVVGIDSLHPYEYVYFNQLVGGVDGAYKRFELDFWCTSYRQAVQYINEVAPVNSTVAVWGPIRAASDFGRSDLKFENEDKPTDSPEFALRCVRGLGAPDYFPSYAGVFAVTRGEAVFSIVKARPDLAVEIGAMGSP